MFLVVQKSLRLMIIAAYPRLAGDRALWDLVIAFSRNGRRPRVLVVGCGPVGLSTDPMPLKARRIFFAVNLRKICLRASLGGAKKARKCVIN